MRPDRPERGAFGINENLAREILELHTLGVDGGYTQEDVTSFAQIMTGWSIGGGGGGSRAAILGNFIFAATCTSPARKCFSASATAEQGQAEGEAVLADLARPSRHRAGSSRPSW